MFGSMEKFFATCPRGLELLLADELRALKAEKVHAVGGGVQFVGDFFLCYRVNLASRLTDIGKPGRVYAADPIPELAGDGYAWKRSRRRNLKGIDGRTRLYALLPETSSASAGSSDDS